MPINLSKGQKVDLTKGNPGLTKIMVGLGWDVNAFDSGSAFDLDAAAFLLGASGKCPTEHLLRQPQAQHRRGGAHGRQPDRRRRRR